MNRATLVVFVVVVATASARADTTVFVRGDFEVKNRDVANLDMYVLGARFLLDVI